MVVIVSMVIAGLMLIACISAADGEKAEEEHTKLKHWLHVVWSFLILITRDAIACAPQKRREMRSTLAKWNRLGSKQFVNERIDGIRITLKSH